ncbi:HNH endonuclease [Deinococcus sp. KNUC1210]|uniref:HNH endonuclease n=1 Tax=Deinococcus sp. KNUC1210 TaxID=2917691 RepID=UPI00351D50EE
MSRNANARERVSYKSNGLCFYCGDVESHLEHKTPLGRGGSRYDENLVVACARCNNEKLFGNGQNDNMNLKEFRQLRQRQLKTSRHIFYGEIYNYLFDPRRGISRLCKFCDQQATVVAYINLLIEDNKPCDFFGACVSCAENRSLNIFEHGYSLP